MPRLAASVAGTLYLLLVIGAAHAQDCVGDCNDSGTVTIEELILGVNINLGNQPISACPAWDCDGSGTVPINCLIQGISNSLEGCGGDPCPLAAGTYTLTQVEGGTVRVGTLSTIPFPTGGTIVLDVGAASQPGCEHDAVIPAVGGFTSPAFCIQGLGFTARLTQNGCGIGRIVSNGGADFGITELGDTSSQPECNNQQECTAGVDSRLRVDVDVGDGSADTCTSGSANAIFTFPVRTVSWFESTCPATDGMYNPGTDTLVLDVQQVLDFTTDISVGSWMDLSGDGCSIAGTGPPSGLMNTGSCWDIAGQSITIAASGTIASMSPPLFDFSFTTVLPNSITAGPSQGATCASPPAINFDGTAIRCLE